MIYEQKLKSVEITFVIVLIFLLIYGLNNNDGILLVFVSGLGLINAYRCHVMSKLFGVSQ